MPIHGYHEVQECVPSSWLYFHRLEPLQVVDYLGRLIYSCLDWGLGNNVERELNASLEGLVCQMTKVTLGQNMEDSIQPVRSLAEVIQVGDLNLVVVVACSLGFFFFFLSEVNYKDKSDVSHTLILILIIVLHTLSLCLWVVAEIVISIKALRPRSN